MTADRVRQVRPLTRKELQWLKAKRIRQALDDIAQELESLAQGGRKADPATSHPAHNIARYLREIASLIE